VHVIRSFQHKGLEKLWNEDDPKGVRADLLDRVRRRLTALNAVQDLRELNMPGWGFHPLHGKSTRYALAVNGPWRITFEWEDGDALRVDLEQYH
jgi:proteic killer suppression protein